ncbi:MAG TPA: amidohydrolase family protein [Xanthobacteraceae bacterium]|jgi:cytosine/adenosine deaminase-related metal-dependent hydrolase
MHDSQRTSRRRDPFVGRRRFIASAAATVVASAAGRSRLFAQSGQPRTLLKGGVVLSFDRSVGDFDRADVLIEGRKIAAVRPDIDAQATVVDASDRIVLPGFIDSHHHFYQSALRNILANGLLADYFRDISGAATKHYRPQDAHIGTLIGALGSIDAGITTITDLSQVSNTPEHSDALIKGLMDAGIRAIYAYSRGSGPGAKFPADVERIQKQYFSSADQLVSLAMGTAVSKEQWLLARRYGLRIFTHVVGSNAATAPDQVMKLGDAGLMGPDNVYIHFTNATKEQMRRVKDSGGSLSIACPIEMAMRHGMPPIQQALDAGIRPSLSSDVETTMAADMFTQMRAVFTLQRALLNERAIKGEKELPPLLTARDVIEFATLHGARADGLEAKIGTLTPGKEADIVMLRTDLPNTLPFNNAYGAIVTGMDTSNVDTVFIAGKIVKRAGKLVGVDFDSVRRQAAASRDYLIDKLGWPRSVIDTSLPGH